MSTKITKQEFLDRAPKEYTYTNVHLKNGLQNSWVTANCKLHGSWNTTPSSILQGRGCPECAKKQRGRTKIENNKLKFIEKTSGIHGNIFNYDMSKYINNNTKIPITCSKGHIFYQTPKDHLTGRGCKECSCGWGFKRSFFTNKQTKLYYIQFINGIFKIGITSQKYISQRFNSSMKYKPILVLDFPDGSKAWDLERKILNTTKSAMYKGSVFIDNNGNQDGETECRITDILPQIEKIITGENYEQFCTRIT